MEKLSTVQEAEIVELEDLLRTFLKVAWPVLIPSRVEETVKIQFPKSSKLRSQKQRDSLREKYMKMLEPYPEHSVDQATVTDSALELETQSA